MINSSGKRPFGVSILYMGWDKHYGYQLYQSDPSGNYGGWKATCIGNNSAVSTLLTIERNCDSAAVFDFMFFFSMHLKWSIRLDQYNFSNVYNSFIDWLFSQKSNLQLGLAGYFFHPWTLFLNLTGSFATEMMDLRVLRYTRLQLSSVLLPVPIYLSLFELRVPCNSYWLFNQEPLYSYYFHLTLQAAVSSLKQEYKENETTLAEAQALAIKVLSKTLDMTKLTPEKGIIHFSDYLSP